MSSLRMLPMDGYPDWRTYVIQIGTVMSNGFCRQEHHENKFSCLIITVQIG